MQAHHITSGKSSNWRSSLVTSLIHHDHSPTAIALGSSAIGKVWGQNRFRTLYGSLDQIRLGPPQGSAEGSTPRFVKFRGVSGLLGQIGLGLPKGSTEGFTKLPPRLSKFRMSLVLWSRSVLGFHKVPWKVGQGSTKVSPRFYQGFIRHSKGLGAK